MSIPSTGRNNHNVLIANRIDRNTPYNTIPELPPVKLNIGHLMAELVEANRLLAELKGYCKTLPDPRMLLNTIALQESKDSSAIENIITTQDELYKATLQLSETQGSANAKEVIRYREAMYWGLGELMKNGLITTNVLTGIMQRIKETDAGIRKHSGTRIVNTSTKEVIYTPPEGEEIIRQKLSALERFINETDVDPVDPLIKMSMVHYQFEAIHPFSDGNGRTGRILNVLYLISQQRLDLPVLYLSRYIINHKGDYYRLLREVSVNGDWDAWVLFMLRGISHTAKDTMEIIDRILALKAKMLAAIGDVLGPAHATVMADLLFANPYIKIRVLEEKGIAKRETASKYLQKLVSNHILTEKKMGRDKYYINHQLMELLSN